MPEGQVGHIKTEEEQKIFETQMISQCCDKIIGGIKRGANHNRAIWELSQNARDVSDINGCEIKISLVGNDFIFAHNGKPFDYKSLISLILQVSSKEKIDTHHEFAGRFGTGFMEAQAFGKKIYLEGSYKVDIDKYVDINPVVIDREFDVSNRENIRQRLSKNVDEVSLLKDNKSYSEPKEFTEFKFRLIEDNIKENAKEALNNACAIIPFVLVLNNRIKKYTVVIEDKEYVFTRKGDDTDVNADGLKVMTIQKTGKDEEEINCYYLELPEDNGIVILPFENQTKGADFSEYSKLFCYFPLLGTENFGFNFIFNSKKFEPEQSRNKIQLPSYNDNTKKLADINAELLRQMQKYTLDYLSKHIAEISDVIKFADINFHYVGDEDKNKPLRVFFNQYHNDWVEQFKEFKIVEGSDDNRYSVSDSVNIRFIDKEITDFLSEKKKFLSSVFYFAGWVSNLPKEEEILKWSGIVQNWGCVDEQLISIDEICSKINNEEDYTEGYLYDFLTVVKSLKKDELFNKYALIPNREEQLCYAKELKHANFISDKSYDIVLNLSKETASKFVAETYKDIYSFEEYNVSDLKKDINEVISKKRSEFIEKGKYFDTDFEKALYKYCSVFTTNDGTSTRDYLMPLIGMIIGQEFERVVDSNLVGESELFTTPFRNLVEHVCLKIQEEKNINKEILKAFLTVAVEDSYLRENVLHKYSIFYNQNSTLELLVNLKKQGNIDNELIQIYNEAVQGDLKNKLIDREFEFAKLEIAEYGEKQVGQEIEQTLIPKIDSKEEDDTYSEKEIQESYSIVIKIIEQLDKGKWEGIFPTISAKKAEYFFKRVKGADRDNVYQLMKLDSEKLKEVTDVATNIQLLKEFNDFKEQKKREQASLAFKKQIGEYVESLLQQKIQEELNGTFKVDLTVDDIQGGQDLIIKYNGKEIYYIEIKTKWEWDRPALLSKLQREKAIDKRDYYAVCCVNMSEYYGEDRFNPGVNTIIERTRVLLNVGTELEEQMQGLPLENSVDEDNINISVSYSCNIPKKVFVSGQPFDSLVSVIVDKIRKEESR